MMAGTALFSELAGRSFAGHDSTIKVALVGCGFRGTGAATQVLSTKGPVKLWAMADLFHDRLEASYHRLAHGIQADYDREASAGLPRASTCRPSGALSVSTPTRRPSTAA